MYDYSPNTNYGEITDIFSGIAAMMGVISIILVIIGIIGILSQWIIYKKAGKGGWESIIPIYNQIVLLQIVGLPIWYILLLFIPIANIYVMFKMYIELAHKFGKSTGFGVATVFFNFICLPILAFHKKCIYNGENNKAQNNTVNNVQATPQNNNNQENENINNNQGPITFTPTVNTDLNSIGSVQQPLQFNPLQPASTEKNSNQSNSTQQLNTTTINPPMNNSTVPLTVVPGMNNQPQNPELNVISSIGEMQQSISKVVSNVELTQQSVPSNIISNQVDLTQQPTTIPTPLDNQTPQINIGTEVQTPTEPITFNQQPKQINQGINVIPNMGTLPRPIENNVINNQINPISKTPQETSTTQMNNSQQPLNVIPGMGNITQPTIPVQNPENNQNM